MLAAAHSRTPQGPDPQPPRSHLAQISGWPGCDLHPRRSYPRQPVTRKWKTSVKCNVEYNRANSLKRKILHIKKSTCERQWCKRLLLVFFPSTHWSMFTRLTSYLISTWREVCLAYSFTHPYKSSKSCNFHANASSSFNAIISSCSSPTSRTRLLTSIITPVLYSFCSLHCWWVGFLANVKWKKW